MISGLIIRQNTVTKRGETTYYGDMSAIAREIARVCLRNEEFAVAMKLAMIPVNEELEAIQLRDEMIGIIKNS